MARRKTSAIERTAEHLLGVTPIAVHRRTDGVLVVLDPQGRKLTFSPAEVGQAEKDLARSGIEPKEAG